jgi:hypothetical protein
MDIDDLHEIVDDVIEEGPVSDPASVAILLLTLDKLEAFATSCVLSYRLSRAAWNRGGLEAPRDPRVVTPS